MNILFVVDVQKALITEEVRKLPVKIRKLIERKAFSKVYFFKFSNTVTSNWTRQLGWNQMLNEEDTVLANELLEFSDNQNTFSKRATFSAFSADGFLQKVTLSKSDTIYVCGMDTHACVLMTVMNAWELEYNVKVIEDVCGASHGKEYHDKAIEILTRNLGKSAIVNSDDIVTLEEDYK